MPVTDRRFPFSRAPYLRVVGAEDDQPDNFPHDTERPLPMTPEEALDEEARSTSLREQLWAFTAMNVFPLLAIGTAVMSVIARAENARITSMSMGVITVAFLIGRTLTQRSLRAKARRINPHR